ncbi:MAG: DUF2589 domain-containing protein [Bacteroidales bacterium]|uniref:DUF2589 domain-containing protein n=1 Tax=Porphyromonas sp. TaxID=1924944 RepID=UPI0029715235|nr:DUF2589 domain-containing protein [Porphyromonas sp.]MDD7438736.1 DUF2589 domain-containing protein [Bacteroidales bacterium]MDY3066994.1 DUF2589 domain-containing protein [Porphyromonas sp.]
MADKDTESKKDKDSASDNDHFVAMNRAVMSGLSDIPFTHLISAPLRACVAAQNESHQTTITALQELGILSDGKDNKVAVSIGFEFVKDGKRQKIMVPLITLVPITFFQINSIDISFKASLKASSQPRVGLPASEPTKQPKKEENKEDGAKNNASQEGKGGSKGESGDDEKSKEKKEEETSVWKKVAEYGGKLWDAYQDYKKSKEAKDSESQAEYSNKKDSKATQESRYSIETTVDFKIQAGPADMPGGLAKILETLNNSVSVIDPTGALRVLGSDFVVNASIAVEYLNEIGILDPHKIRYSPTDGVEKRVEEGLAILKFGKAGTYKIQAGEKEQTITVAGA